MNADQPSRQVLNDLAERLFPAIRASVPGQRPVAVRGSRKLGAKLGYYETDLDDGTLGFGMRRGDDCLQAAIATLLQLPPTEVPDLRIDQQLAAGTDPEEIARNRIETLVRWADQRGLTIGVHPSPPTSERRWIGIIPEPGLFNNHALVMCKTELLYDPSILSVVGNPLNLPLPARTPDQIELGVTIRKE